MRTPVSADPAFGAKAAGMASVTRIVENEVFAAIKSLKPKFGVAGSGEPEHGMPLSFRESSSELPA